MNKLTKEQFESPENQNRDKAIIGFQAVGKTLVYGASDDLIEVDGAMSEEWNVYDAKNIKITCSDGTVARIGYDGNWHITVKETGPMFDKIVNGNPAEDPHTDEDCKRCSAYSDVLVMKAGLEWVRIKGKTVKPVER